MICPGCLQPIHQDWSTCPECGTKITVAAGWTPILIVLGAAVLYTVVVWAIIAAYVPR